MTIHISTWEGKVDFTVTPIGDFKVVLGMDFLRNVKVMPWPFLCSMAILEEKTSCVVPTVTENTPKAPLLSVMQVKKGLKKRELTYLATLKEDKEAATRDLMPKAIERVLDKFNDVMPFELPKRLPPRKDEDHKIKRELGLSPMPFGRIR